MVRPSRAICAAHQNALSDFPARPNAGLWGGSIKRTRERERMAYRGRSVRFHQGAQSFPEPGLFLPNLP